MAKEYLERGHPSTSYASPNDRDGPRKEPLRGLESGWDQLHIRREEEEPVREGSSDDFHFSSVEETGSLIFGGGSEGASFDSNEALSNNAKYDEKGKGSSGTNLTVSQRAYTSNSPRPPQVHFSPLGLSVSPMIGSIQSTFQPLLKFPVGPSSDSKPVRAILKNPRTPGTGQRVRFVNLTGHDSELPLTPESSAGTDSMSERSAFKLDHADLQSGKAFPFSSKAEGPTSKSFEELTQPVIEIAASRSFLEKLHAAIPSPDSSQVEGEQYMLSVPCIDLVSVAAFPSSPRSEQHSKIFENHVTQNFGAISEESAIEDLFAIAAPQSSTNAEGSKDYWQPDSNDNSGREDELALDLMVNICERDEDSSEVLKPVRSTALNEDPHFGKPAQTIATSGQSFLEEFLQKRRSSFESAKEASLRDDVTEKISNTSNTWAIYESNPTAVAEVTNVSLVGGDISASQARSQYYTPERLAQSWEEDSQWQQRGESEKPSLNDVQSQFAPVQPETHEHYEEEISISRIRDSLFLSPIYEESEPNTTASITPSTEVALWTKCSSNYSKASSGQPNNLSDLRTANCDPTLQQDQMDEFDQRLAHRANVDDSRSTSAFHQALGGGLLQSFFTTQTDLLANSNSQKLLLSTLMVNFREEMARKDAAIINLRSQKAEMASLHKARCQMDESHDKASRIEWQYSKAKVEALEDLVRLLTDELEKRTSMDRQKAQKVDAAVQSLQDSNTVLKTSLKDMEIRLRHAQASQQDAETMRIDTEKRSQHVLYEHEQFVAKQTAKATSTSPEKTELQRDNIIRARTQAEHEADHKSRTSEEEARLEDSEINLAKALKRIKELELVEQSQSEEIRRVNASWTENKLAQAKLLDMVEHNTSQKRPPLIVKHQGPRITERTAVKELTETDDERRSRMEADHFRTAEECERLTALVKTLRRESAAREVTMARLRRARSNLQEDVDGLNIALDAKQQEVSMWKRQVFVLRPPTKPRKQSVAAKAKEPSGKGSPLNSMSSINVIDTPSYPRVRQSKVGDPPSGRNKTINKMKENRAV